MKVGDRVRDLVLSRGEGRIVSFSFCEDSSCSCPGFVQVHWCWNRVAREDHYGWVEVGFVDDFPEG